ncbi:hypothetical protein ACLMJK_000901 [Lecanora helva]
MSISKLITYCGILSNLVLSIPLDNPQTANSIFQPTGPQNESIIPYLISHSNLNLTAGGNIKCNEQRYGNPSADSCRDAVAQIPQDPMTLMRNKKRSYGARSPALVVHVGLPKRWISADGKCVADITQRGLPPISHVNDMDIFSAATIIFETCVEENPQTPIPWGGESIQMSDEGNLQVIVQAYKPPFIRCAGAPPTSRPDSNACKTILDSMKATTGLTKFGAVGVEGIEEQLPMVLNEPTGKCKIIIDITAPDDIAQWYDIWAAAAALDGMCARGGRTGKSRFLGTNRKLTVEIKKS